MHLIASIPGGWNPNQEGVIHIEQQPGDIIFLSAADTELATVFEAYRSLQEEHTGLPSLRLANLVYFKQELTIDTYLEEVLSHAKVCIIRPLGGLSYFPYLIQQATALAEEKGIKIVFLPGYDTTDRELTERSNIPQPIVHQLWEYCLAGGVTNYQGALKLIAHYFFQQEFTVEPPERVPDIFWYHPDTGKINIGESLTDNARAVIIAYRAHYLSHNLDPLVTLMHTLEKQGISAAIIFVHSLREKGQVDELAAQLEALKKQSLQLIINTTSFSIRQFRETDQNFIFNRLELPVLQAVHSSTTREAWAEGDFGLSPTDVAMNIALPELDGRINTSIISFKEEREKDLLTDSKITLYKAYPPGCEFVARLTRQFLQLQELENHDKKIALVLPNYPNKDSRLANGVGLDTPESAVKILQALAHEGYQLGESYPSGSGELMEAITSRITNETGTLLARPYQFSLSREVFDQYFSQVGEDAKKKMTDQWGPVENDPYFDGEAFAIPGLCFGHVFVSIQPSRGYHIDIQQTYHSPDLPPPYHYMAFYFWMKHEFKAHAVIHLGKHGNLEWLPGKSIALDEKNCYPAAILDTLPHFYPFIINDPGEGTQAKRRNQAVIIDHLVPPMTRAETYGALTDLENLADEYYEAANLDPKRTKLLEGRIREIIEKQNLQVDLGIESGEMEEWLLKLDGYLCELKEAQIRDGLHILGESPANGQLVDLIIALHRMPDDQVSGITQALAKDLALSIDPLEVEYGQPFGQKVRGVYCRHNGDVVEHLEECAKALVALAIDLQSVPKIEQKLPATSQVIAQILQQTLPALKDTELEISNLLAGLEGKYVPAGGSGAPTRGKRNILPTGRNFYAVDVRTIPTATAYQVGQKSAAALIDLYLQEHGEYPENIGISVWGTATMRTGGDDLAQAMALMGVKPVWQKNGRRMIDFEVIPLFQLTRPRIDVTLRISGFFRDAFPDIIRLFNAIVTKLAHLEEPVTDNFIRKRFLEDKKSFEMNGMSTEEVEQKSLYRVFGSKPGAYGAGLQALIESQAWEHRDELAETYLQWSHYAYNTAGKGVTLPDVFRHRVGKLQVVVQNQDNREHDLLDSDDYYQFQGGLANAVESVSGKQPATYFGDHSRPHQPKIKTLKQELLKVFRSRVVNPKWIEGVKRHGYKGAFEMAATLDYLFAYDATTGLVEDFMYENIAKSYLVDPDNREFLDKANPWALRDMSERLLEAIQRGMWNEPDPAIREKLEAIYLAAE
ncbi:cobaltochelatase subunit CobN [Fulvivirga sp. M361]|uniref:cobaltochelatase subunit CobN n=1 Tax=Fulvivirga sp. M361 TaxID=2594266 RepID=UPI00117AFE7F|nr:cobaltochelatase subunit CobN [Fulvivirga sp. M361]TRX62754.1 cobaltochelatase subunit CobN [Fulvivirga sp. M361]